MVKSVMVHSFSKVPRAEIPRSSFDRSHGLKTSLDADFLVPILLDDIVPGDTFNVSCNFIARLTSPTVLPLFDNLYFETFFFFVPYRLVWDNWEKFLGAQDDPGDSISYTIPVIAGTNLTDTGDIGDYFGLPYGKHADDYVTCSALPFRAYYLIWDEWFRDENLQDSVSALTSGGPDPSYNGFPCLKRGKRHDYFTSCLPWPQKQTLPVSIFGDETIDLRMQGGDNTTPSLYDDTRAGAYTLDTDGTAGGEVAFTASAGQAGENMYIDLGDANSSINDLRLAFQTQRLLERDARAGTRYTETILAHYGVTVPDFRLQRPEFLGGGSSRVMVSPVAQTTYQGTQTVEDAKGALSGIGVVNGTHSWTKSFVEHGVIIGLANVRGDITYSQGIERYWDKQTRYDFYYPVLSMIGEQSVLNREIFFSDVLATDNAVFGYQERYAEMRYKPSRLSGLMRVDAASNLDEFHLSEDFASVPTLDDTFIQSNTGTPLDRALSVPTQPHFVVDMYFSMRCARPMPLYGVPGNLDHF